jgi:hypothetical protein
MTDCVANFDNTQDTDNDEEKRVKFENRRYTILKVYHCFNSFL